MLVRKWIWKTQNIFLVVSYIPVQVFLFLGAWNVYKLCSEIDNDFFVSYFLFSLFFLLIDHPLLQDSYLIRTILMGNKFECKETPVCLVLRKLCVGYYLHSLYIYIPFRFKYSLYNRIGRWSIVTKDSLSLIMPYTKHCLLLLNWLF